MSDPKKRALFPQEELWPVDSHPRDVLKILNRLKDRLNKITLPSLTMSTLASDKKVRGRN